VTVAAAMAVAAIWRRGVRCDAADAGLPAGCALLFERQTAGFGRRDSSDSTMLPSVKNWS